MAAGLVELAESAAGIRKVWAHTLPERNASTRILERLGFNLVHRRQFATAALVAVIATSHAQASDPWIGTWKVNLARSTYSPGPTPKVAATIKMESAPGGIKTTIDGANAQGQPTHTENVAAFDGKDSPVKGAAVPNTTTALKRIDARTFEAQGKVSGKPTVTTRIAISADGKTLTATQSGQNAQGQAVKNVIVADKQ